MEELNALLRNAGDGLCVVFCYTKWCTPCKNIIPKFEEIHENLPEVTFLEIDMDHQTQIAFSYDIRAVPTFLFIRGGNILETLVGNNYELLLKFLEKYQQVETCEDAKYEGVKQITVDSSEQQGKTCVVELGKDTFTSQTESNAGQEPENLTFQECIEHPVKTGVDELIIRIVEEGEETEKQEISEKANKEITIKKIRSREQRAFQTGQGKSPRQEISSLRQIGQRKVIADKNRSSGVNKLLKYDGLLDELNSVRHTEQNNT